MSYRKTLKLPQSSNLKVTWEQDVIIANSEHITELFWQVLKWCSRPVQNITFISKYQRESSPILSTVCTWKAVVGNNVKDLLMIINDPLEMCHAFLHRLQPHTQHTDYCFCFFWGGHGNRGWHDNPQPVLRPLLAQCANPCVLVCLYV